MCSPIRELITYRAAEGGSTTQMDSGVKKYFKVKRSKMAGTKRSATDANLGDREDESQQDQKSGGESGTESAGMGLVVSSIQHPLSMGVVSLKIEMAYMWSIVNSASACLYQAAAAPANTFVLASDFFELPFNNLCFWIPPRHASWITSIGAAWKVHSPSCWIDNMNYIAGQEATTAASKIDYSGNYAPTIDILSNEPITPQARTRYSAYDAYGRQRAVPANGAAVMQTMCTNAQIRPVGLPVINFETNVDGIGTFTAAPPWFRHVTNHKMDSSLSFSPPCFDGWRRTAPAFDAPTVIGAEIDNYNTSAAGALPTNLNEKIPYWNGSNNGYTIANGYLASDNVNRSMSFRSNSTGELINGPVCQPTYIRIRDPPKWGDGATAGSSSTSPIQQIALKANLNMRTSCIIEVDMNLAYQVDATVNYNNNRTFAYPTSAQYIPTYINTGAPVNPDCGIASQSDFKDDITLNRLLKHSDVESIYSDSD